jgi:hypothetical protein
MSSKISTEKYDPVKLERLKQYLENNAGKGNPKFYEIYVDNLKAVDKTNDPACFDDYQMYQNEDTRIIKVLIYTSTENCPRNDKFIFTLRDPYQEKRQEELSGVEVENRITTAIQQERNRNQLEQLQKELEETKLKLEECEQYSGELEDKLEAVEKEFEAFRKKRVALSEMNTGKLVGFATDYFIKNYPDLSRKLPVISTLSGLLAGEEDAEQLLAGTGHNKNETAESQTSFRKKETSEQAQQADIANQTKLAFFSQMEEAFSEEQLTMMLQITQGLMAKPEQLSVVYELVIVQETGSQKAAEENRQL